MSEQSMRNLAEVLRDEMVMSDQILARLGESPKTIPELAEAVTVWVMAMRRYGRLTELPKGRADDYFQYALPKEIKEGS